MDVEYRVRPVTRFVVTRWYSSEREAGCDTKGEFANEATAQEVAAALRNDEDRRAAACLCKEAPSDG